MPLGDLEDEAMAKVLIVAQDQVLVENVKRELPLERSFKLAVAASGFDAGIQAESFHPDCIIVDFSIGRELPKRFSIQISYVGRFGRNLLTQRDLNQPLDIVDPKTGIDYYAAASAMSPLVREYANRKLAGAPELLLKEIVVEGNIT